MRKKLAFLNFAILSLFAVPIFAEPATTSYGLQNSLIHIQTPDNWVKVNSSFFTSGGCEVIFTESTAHRHCRIFFEPKPDFLNYNFDYSSQVLDQLFLENNSKYLAPQVTNQLSYSWESKITQNKESMDYFGLALFPLKDFFFAISIKNDLGYEVLSDDVCMFIRSISVTHPNALNNQSEAR